MKKKKKYIVQEHVNCILYLSTEGDLWHAEEREQRQQRYVLEYCKAHGINVVKTLHRDVLGQTGVNRDFSKMVEMIRREQAQGIVVANMKCISTSLPDAYYKIGMVVQAGHIDEDSPLMEEFEKAIAKQLGFRFVYKMSRPNVQKILYKNVQLVCLF